MARLNDPGVDGSYRNLKNTFSQGGPINVTLPFELRQSNTKWKIFAKRMDVGPIIVHRDSSGIGMSYGFQSKPVLNFALLPVEGGEFSGERRELQVIRAYRCAQDEIIRIAALLEDVVVEEYALLCTPVFGEYGNDPGFPIAQQHLDDPAHIRAGGVDIFPVHGVDLL